MKYLPLQTELYSLNRTRFTRKMSPDSIAIFHSNDMMPRSGDTCYPFRQNNALFYLSGLDQPEVVVVIFPDCIKEGFHEVAFIPRTDERKARYDGPQLTPEETRRISGIQKVYFLDQMDSILRELILLAKRIYVNLNEHDRFHTPVTSRDARMLQELQLRYPAHKYHRAAPILKKLMMIKSAYELEPIQQAVNITGQAFDKVLRFVEPGVFEYEVEAEITAEFIRNRATGHAYEPIVASGPNSCILHYIKNTRRCQDGDLLLLDFGAEYANYASDLTRTIPVNGRFSKRQRSIYDAVLRVQRAAIERLQPGTLLEEYHQEVGDLMEGELLNLGLIDKTDIKNQDPDRPAYKKYFMHGTSHHLGLDVHDNGSRYAPIQAGMVFTCEPAIYIPEENLGIRLENDILVTDQEPIDLTRYIPIEAEAIEEAMNAGVEAGF